MYIYFFCYTLYNQQGYRGESNDEFAFAFSITSIEQIQQCEAGILRSHPSAVRAIITSMPLLLRQNNSPVVYDAGEYHYLIGYSVIGSGGRREEYSDEWVLPCPINSIHQIRQREEWYKSQYSWAHEVYIINGPHLLRTSNADQRTERE